MHAVAALIQSLGGWLTEAIASFNRRVLFVRESRIVRRFAAV